MSSKLKPKHLVVLLVAALIALPLLALIVRAAPAASEVSPPALTSVDQQFVQQLIGSPVSADYPRMYGPGDPRPDGLAQNVKPLDQVQRIEMPPVDVEKARAEDVVSLAGGEPPRFALPIAVQIDPSTSGTWEKAESDRLVWRLRIASPKAVSLNLGFTRYFMPRGGRLFIYRPDQQIIVGAFTDRDNEVHGQLWTPIVHGDEIVIEVSLPAAERSDLQLQLTSVNHGYRELGESPLSGACNVDVVCPQGDLWRKEIRSVAVISTGGSTFCTGSMLNNTAQDLKPFFLTANHCSINSGNAASLVTYWNYENSTCRPPGSPASGGPGDGTLNQFMTGSFFRAAYSTSDFTLVELDDPAPAAFHIFWAGWDRTGVDGTSAVAIHHPSTDEKRISFENDPTQVTSYLGTVVPGDGTHVRIVDWDLGTTEPGSSGSPLFDQNHRIIGQLHGGYAACGNDLSDYYGRFFVSWTGSGTSASRLSDWLDPGNTGTTSLDGREQPSFDLTVSPAQQTICKPANATYNIAVTAQTTATVPVSLSVVARPVSTTANFSVNPVTPTGVSLLTISNTNAAADGNYNMFVVGTAMTDVVTVPVGLSINSAAPSVTTLLTPTNNAMNQLLKPTFYWSPPAQAASYKLEVAADQAFNMIVYSATTTAISHTQATDLNLLTKYYWRVRATNGCGTSTSATFNFTTQSGPGVCSPGYAASTIYSNTFESDAAGWAHGGIGDTWVLTSTRTHSGANAFHANDPSTVSDQRLVSPPIAVPAGQDLPNLQFWNHQTMESNTSTSCFDGGIIEISTTLNMTWTQITTGLLTDPYDGPISTSHSNPLGGKNAWCGDPQDWLNSIVDLNAYAGQTVQFRFRLGSDSSVGREGWYIDDVKVQTCVPSALADLQIDKTGWPALAAPGHAITYTIVITNAGPMSVTNATVMDTFPASINTVSWTCSAANGSCGVLNGSGNISTTVTLSNTGTATFIATGTVDAAATGTLSNTAIVTPPLGITDQNLDDNSSTVTNTITQLVFLPLVMK